MHIVCAPSFQPYAFLLTGRRSVSLAASSSDDSSTGHRTPVQSESPTPPFHDVLLAATEHGKFLGQSLELVLPPRIKPVDNYAEAPSSEFCLFIGHMRFETTPADVRWLLKRLCGVTALRAEIRGAGCCMVHLASDTDVESVRALNGRVLFDHDGVWFARDDAAVSLLAGYVERILPRLSGKHGSQRPSLRLPRDTLVVEEPRFQKKLTLRRASAAGSATTSSSPTRTAPATPKSCSRGASRIHTVAPPPYSPLALGGGQAFCAAPPPPYYSAF
jgi:hypothetical protein